MILINCRPILECKVEHYMLYFTKQQKGWCLYIPYNKSFWLLTEIGNVSLPDEDLLALCFFLVFSQTAAALTQNCSPVRNAILFIWNFDDMSLKCEQICWSMCVWDVNILALNSEMLNSPLLLNPFVLSLWLAWILLLQPETEQGRRTSLEKFTRSVVSVPLPFNS